MKKIKLGAFTILLGSLGMIGGNHVFAEAGTLPANRNTDAQVKFIEDDSKTEPVNPLDPDPEKPVKPVDPTNPDKPYEPGTGTNGPLSLDYASVLDFGQQKISVNNEIYYAKPQKLFQDDGKTIDPSSAKPNYAQVTDKRGGEKGWSLNVKQNGQFKSVKKDKELVGAEITFKNGTAKSISTSQKPRTVKETFTLKTDGLGSEDKVMAAAEGEGFGTWVYNFGDDSNMDKSIELSVPGSTAKEADVYKTSLTWTLSDTPENK